MGYSFMKLLFNCPSDRLSGKRWLRWLSLAGAILGYSATAQPEVPTDIWGEVQVYKEVDGRELRVWVTQSEVTADAAPRPVIIFFHGGGWVGGSPSVFNEQSAYFSSRGMVCVNVEYRMLDRKVPDPPLICIQDAKSAIRWIRIHAREFGADPDRIASFGASAGGHLAAVVGMSDGFDDPNDDLGVSAQSQAMLMLNPVIHNGPGPEGYGYKRIAEEYEQYSPFHYDKTGAPPGIIFIGTRDRLIPLDMILEFKRSMEWAGARCDVEVYYDEDHSFFNERNADGRYFYLTTIAADRFLASLGWLEGPPTLSVLEGL